MQFLDLPDTEVSREDANVIILPIPYEETTSFGKGTVSGPTAIIEASAQLEFFDEELEIEPKECGIFTEDPIIFNGAKGEKAINLIEAATNEIIKKGRFPLGLGGEHSISTGLIKALFRKHPDLHVVHIDAHADMRDEYSGTKWSHACVMKRIHDLGIPFTSIGIRSLCKDQFEAIKAIRKNYFFAYELVKNDNWINEALATINGPVYLTFDVDGLDSSVVPATGTPEPGGLTWYQATDFITELMKNKKVVGADVVELSPNDQSRASNFTIAKLVHKIIGNWWKYSN